MSYITSDTTSLRSFQPQQRQNKITTDFPFLPLWEWSLLVFNGFSVVMNLKRLAVDARSFWFGKHEGSVGARFSRFSCKFVWRKWAQFVWETHEIVILERKVPCLKWSGNIWKCVQIERISVECSKMQSFSSELYRFLWISSQKSCSSLLMLEGKTMALFYKKLPVIYLIVVFAMKRLCVLSFIWRKDFSQTVSEGSGEDFLFGCG